MDSNSINTVANTLTENSEVISGLIRIVSATIYAVATIFAACVAIYGIKSWREDFRGKRQIELAEDVLALFYEAKNAIIAIRSPLGYGGEGTTRKQGENETPEQKKARDNAFVVFERFKEREQVFNKLLSLRYRFMAQIGRETEKPFEEIRSITNKIFIAARMLADLWSTDITYYTPKRQEKHFESVQKYKDIFWEGAPEDELSERLEKAVLDMENICCKVISGEKQKRV